MDKVLVWFDGKHYYNICAVCGELYPIYKVEDHIIYNLKKLKCQSYYYSRFNYFKYGNTKNRLWVHFTIYNLYNIR